MESLRVLKVLLLLTLIEATLLKVNSNDVFSLELKKIGSDSIMKFFIKWNYNLCAPYKFTMESVKINRKSRENVDC